MIPKINFTDVWLNGRQPDLWGTLYWGAVDVILGFPFLSLWNTSEMLLISLWDPRKGIHFISPPLFPPVRTGWVRLKLPRSSGILGFPVVMHGGHTVQLKTGRPVPLKPSKPADQTLGQPEGALRTSASSEAQLAVFPAPWWTHP